MAATARTVDGLVVYRFGSGLYFANAARLLSDVDELMGGGALRWFCLDAAAVGDVDYSAATVLTTVFDKLRRAGVRVVAANVADGVRAELDRYGIAPDGWYDTSGQALESSEHGEDSEHGDHEHGDHERETTHG